MADLFPALPDLVIPAQGEPGLADFGVNPVFDFARGDFVMTPTGRLVEVSGEDALWAWVEKVIYTARYRYVIYPWEYGFEGEEVLGAGLSPEATESELARMIREAIIYDDRVRDVSGFVFEWGTDWVHVQFSVQSVLGGVKLFSARLGV